MKHVLLVTLLVVMLAVPSAVLFASPDTGGASAPLTKGTPVPTPEQPPEIEEGWVLTTGCVIQTYGDSAPWTFKIWFKYLGGYGYGTSYIYYYTGTQVLAEVYPGPSPMGVASFTLNVLDPWCDPTGEPIGALDGGVIGGSGVAMGRVSGLAREAAGISPCRGSEPNDTQAQAVGATKALDSFYGTQDEEDWFLLLNAVPGVPMRAAIAQTDGDIFLHIRNGTDYYYHFCPKGSTNCGINLTPTEWYTWAQVTDQDGATDVCQNYALKAN